MIKDFCDVVRMRFN